MTDEFHAANTTRIWEGLFISHVREKGDVDNAVTYADNIVNTLAARQHRERIRNGHSDPPGASAGQEGITE